jgi:hypothetical protein
MFEAPISGQPTTKTVSGYEGESTWCPVHEAWGHHLLADCRKKDTLEESDSEMPFDGSNGKDLKALVTVIKHEEDSSIDGHARAAVCCTGYSTGHSPRSLPC